MLVVLDCSKSELKYLGCVLDESSTHVTEFRKKVESRSKVRSLANARCM